LCEAQRLVCLNPLQPAAFVIRSFSSPAVEMRSSDIRQRLQNIIARFFRSLWSIEAIVDKFCSWGNRILGSLSGYFLLGFSR
jgi:hypothetical protein